MMVDELPSLEESVADPHPPKRQRAQLEKIVVAIRAEIERRKLVADGR
jgi:hypothetical protein